VSLEAVRARGYFDGGFSSPCQLRITLSCRGTDPPSR
jgi:hypothetical protein